MLLPKPCFLASPWNSWVWFGQATIQVLFPIWSVRVRYSLFLRIFYPPGCCSPFRCVFPSGCWGLLPSNAFGKEESMTFWHLERSGKGKVKAESLMALIPFPWPLKSSLSIFSPFIYWLVLGSELHNFLTLTVGNIKWKSRKARYFICILFRRQDVRANAFFSFYFLWCYIWWRWRPGLLFARVITADERADGWIHPVTPLREDDKPTCPTRCACNRNHTVKEHEFRAICSTAPVTSIAVRSLWTSAILWSSAGLPSPAASCSNQWPSEGRGVQSQAQEIWI